MAVGGTHCSAVLSLYVVQLDYIRSVVLPFGKCAGTHSAGSWRCMQHPAQHSRWYQAAPNQIGFRCIMNNYDPLGWSLMQDFRGSNQEPLKGLIR